MPAALGDDALDGAAPPLDDGDDDDPDGVMLAEVAARDSPRVAAEYDADGFEGDPFALSPDERVSGRRPAEGRGVTVRS